MTFFKMFLVVVMTTFMAGCSAMPYKTEFSCPEGEKGQCTSVQNAYEYVRKVEDDPDSVKRTADEPGDFGDLLSKYERCVERKDSRCMREMENKITTMFQAAKQVGVDAERMNQQAMEEDTRRDMLRKYATGRESQAVFMPPTVMEVFILPYQTESGALAGERTFWLTLNQGKWVWPGSEADNSMSKIGAIR